MLLTETQAILLATTLHNLETLCAESALISIPHCTEQLSVQVRYRSGTICVYLGGPERYQGSSYKLDEHYTGLKHFCQVYKVLS